MWGLLCFVLVVFTRDSYGYIGDKMTETIQLCCNEGRTLARSHSYQDCSASQPVPAGVASDFESLCVIARAQCCREYFQKKRDCDTGIDIATSLKTCSSTKDSAKLCCEECMKGSNAKEERGVDVCKRRSNGNGSEELLADDAYIQCCEKIAHESYKNETVATNSVVVTRKPVKVIASLCEDYAPNELCAHHCIPVPGSYRCECNPGYMLMADGRNCKKVIRNRCKPHNPCQHKCNDNGVEVMCSCRRGYELMADGKSCQDIDECQLNLQVCLPGTQCSNVQGSYKCIPIKKDKDRGKCPPGFSRNIINHVCDDINECKLPNPPCPFYLCENTIGGFKCGGVAGDLSNLGSTPVPPAEDKCPTGFKMGATLECEDVDECAMHKDDCNKLSQFCINTHGAFHCQDIASKHCPPGFKINALSGRCEDIDECEDDDEICREDQICVNQLGQYDCKQKEDKITTSKPECPDGMRLQNGFCEDIDECKENTHLCDLHQSCLNTNGSYDCHCKYGYELDITTNRCVDINECATGQNDCLIGSQRCDNTVGSYLCIRITSCGTGYILHHSTGKCEDIDECALGTHNCLRAGPEYQCFNIPGSFRCVRRRPTTTPLPEYEYEYYDSEEDINGNQTGIDMKPPQPTPTPTTTTTTTTTKPTEPPTTQKSTTEVSTELTPAQTPDDRINNVVPVHFDKEKPDITYVDTKPPERPTTYQPETETTEKREPETPALIENEIQPEIPYVDPKQPEFHPIPESTSEREDIEGPKYDYAPEDPVTPFAQPKPEERSESPIPIPETPPTKVPPRFDYGKAPPKEPEISNTIDPIPLPESPETTYRTPEGTSPQYPHTVLLNPGKEEAVVPGVKKEDGSVVIDTNNVPIDKWTKIDTRPAVECPPGFEKDNDACFDIDECASNTHSCSGLTESCRNTMGGYVCDCAPGFRRDLTTGACDIVTTSSTSTTSTTTSTLPPPTTTEKSKNFFWGYPDYRPPSRPFRPINLCDAGFHLNSQTGRCEDINECTNGQANCASVEICVNTEGGYRCECPPNWRLDEVRHRCMPIRVHGKFPTGYGNVPTYPTTNTKMPVNKAPNPKVPVVTHVDQGSVFKCPWGYKLNDDNTCQDIDECATGEAKCGRIQICTNQPGGYTCSCPPGHRLVGDHECEDVDECVVAGRMPICSQNADCLNTVGSYQCRCHKGFRSAPVNDKVCVDVDECTEARAGTLCQQRCNNVWGSYRCSCHRGYRLNPDNKTCSDIDECVEFKSNVPCVGRCLNEPGSYRCACPGGYRLSEDKRSCIDIDECETGIASCAKSGVFGGTSHICLNTRGSYRCHRISCPPGYRLESKHRCKKIETLCSPGDWNCTHQPTSISYNFITFVSKLYIPDSKVNLFTMRGPGWPNARMKFVLRLINVDAPPSVRDKADIKAFLLIQNNTEAAMSLVRPLEGPQSIELELSMELYSRDQFGGIAVAKIFIYVSEYEF
ncbi:hypothetical protein O3G_MSEX004554 [Manduca sexta]|uniref:EGF-like domain-containing protein n=2 Tax=Manduca sexta TaxID=7130 RepID=A0A922CH45_MANSE|nr:hypothetical protein O3G_MSEX004554 [Manduca sexta]